MKIHNIRFGLATNSSSTHSIVFLKNNQGDRLTDIGDGNCYGVNGEFGWEHFTATSPEMKRHYLALTIYYNLKGTIGADAAALIAQEWTQFPLMDKDDSEWNVEPCVVGYIDHQSIMDLPRDEKNPAMINKEFTMELLTFLLRDDVAILGGNDNDPDPHPLLLHNEKRNWELGYESYTSPFIVRKDEEKNYWVAFNQKTGTKFRISFGDKVNEVEKSHFPELVDMKITSMCPFVKEDCFKFCYQASNPQGSHASLEMVRSAINVCEAMGVFEIALGGGETTFHPNFVEILEHARYRNIVPNFTTRSLHWLHDAKLRENIRPLMGACAVSVTSANKVKELGALDILYKFNGHKWGGVADKLSIQYVLGSTSDWDFRNILEEAAKFDLRVTLLGFKHVGRGGNKAPHDYKNWLNHVKELRDKEKCPHIGVDTAIIQEFENELKDAGIPPYLMTKYEGKFSMYWDVVSNSFGPSSYCPSEDMISLKDSCKENWKKELYLVTDKALDTLEKGYATF